ncbi:hypothetical protein [Streptomyces galbus]|uniref:LigA protein n=1 Tax=Streptomyces galbus TaxID=33898 RepID=A0ABX1IXT3_STRGB|nr:hypothetical protein [Streptomyces galbus]NKQ29066.1 hypothetical protein [Streptomyces galbus]
MPVDHGPHLDTPPDPFEDRLSRALHHTGGAFDADRRALAAGGAARGRRKRLLRRTALAGGTAGVAAVCLGGTLLLAPGDRDDTPRPAPVAGRRTATASSTAAPVTADRMIATLKGLLPEGTVSDARGGGSGGRTAAPFAQLVFDDGKGAAALPVGLGRVAPGGDDARQLTECPDKVLAAYDACTSERQPDGSVVRVLKGYEYPDRRVATRLWTADLVSADGAHVSVSEWNAAAEKDAPVTRPEPPLTAAELRDLAAAPAWRDAVGSLPAAEEVTAAPAAPGGWRIAGVLAALMPDGVKVAARGSQDGEFAYVVADDGKGASYVQVNVQPGMSDVAGELFGSGAETLPDGALVAEHQGPGDRGDLVMWTVDTLRPDGRRIVVSAFNAASQTTAATRATPALTMGQLRAIALSSRWLALG